MLTLSNLNRRHKVALFLTLLTTGTWLVSGESARQAIGIALLGAAFAWAFGSDSRLVHWVVTALGSALLLAPVCYEWYEYRDKVKYYERKVVAFEREIPELAKKYSFDKTAIDPQSGASIGWNGARWVIISPGTSTHKIGDEWDGKDWIPESNTPSWVREALQQNVNLKAVPSWKMPSYVPPRPFSLIYALQSEGISVLPGFVLVCIGFGLVIAIRRRGNAEPKGNPRNPGANGAG